MKAVFDTLAQAQMEKQPMVMINTEDLAIVVIMASLFIKDDNVR